MKETLNLFQIFELILMYSVIVTLLRVIFKELIRVDATRSGGYQPKENNVDNGKKNPPKERSGGA
ncbi:hypothetical protein LEP1GSC111_4214 [Leptospira interrogans str. UT126]|uniref:hypothetical protein n=1 Tax=Leptospira interrogans TaxID=173 RepID=UPI0002BDCE02|nr:hypothetical protein [Leptospira interrogans]EMJ55947.1 hypothetical protein LEP1GSC111_4214 [Leptospira interrogans str. UT126]